MWTKSEENNVFFILHWKQICKKFPKASAIFWKVREQQAVFKVEC